MLCFGCKFTMLVICSLVLLFMPYVYDAVRDIIREPGHLKRFGAHTDGRSSQFVDEMDGFPNPLAFHNQYVSSLKPLKMKGAAKLSRAHQMWTDQYFLSLISEDEQVQIESKKKENREQQPTFMTLKEYVAIYNGTDQYLVSSVPHYLRPDVLVPCPLQCDSVLKDHLIDAVVWFSSGGTKSVVHTDSVDNINCLFRGDKELVMVDPSKYAHKVDLDHLEGSYSDIDVDAVDCAKYPGIADVEFYHVNITAGDCLYIPYLWIHQVRSHGSNLAVNVWWDHYKFIEFNPSSCSAKCDIRLTIDKVKFHEMNSGLVSKESINDRIKEVIGVHETIGEDRLVAYYLGSPEVGSLDESDYQHLLERLFRQVDIDHDGRISRQELDTVNQQVWTEVVDTANQLETLQRNANQAPTRRQERADDTIDAGGNEDDRTLRNEL